MAKGDITSVTVAASGDHVTIVVEADAVDVDAYSDYALDIDGTPKVILSLTRPGFNISGGVITVSDTVIGAFPVRKPDPNEADLDIVDNGGSPNTVTLKLWLSDYIFDSDTLVTADFTAGWFTNATAGASGESVTNSSTELYPKPIAQWITVPYQRVTGDFEVEVSAHHKFGVQVVEFDAADQSANSITTIEVDTETFSALPTQGNGHSCYKATIPVSGLDTLETIDCQFIIYPKIGDVILDSRTTEDGIVQPSALLGPLHMLNDKAGTYGVTFAGVDPGGNDGTGVSSNVEATALATPYLTIQAAFAGIKAYNNTNHSRNTVGAGEVVCKAGTYDFTTTAAIAGGNTDTYGIVRPDGVAAVTVGTNTTTNDASSGFFKIEGVTVAGSGVGTFRGNSAVTSGIWFDSLVDGTMSGLAATYSWGVRYITNSNVTAWNDWQGFSTNLAAVKINQGNNWNDVLEKQNCYLFIGNIGDCRTGNDLTVSSDPAPEYMIYAYNTNRGNMSVYTQNVLFFDEACSTGLAVINNIIDPQITGPAAAVFLWADGNTVASENIVLMGCDIEGQRINIGYNDAANPITKLYTVQYNTFLDYNIKTDIFSNDGTDINNWSVVNSVGQIGNNNFEDNGTATAFSPEFGGLDYSTLDPEYVDQSGGDYTPGENLNKGSGTHPLKFDIEGGLRNGFLYAGARTISLVITASSVKSKGLSLRLSLNL